MSTPSPLTASASPSLEIETMIAWWESAYQKSPDADFTEHQQALNKKMQVIVEHASVDQLKRLILASRFPIDGFFPYSSPEFNNLLGAACSRFEPEKVLLILDMGADIHARYPLKGKNAFVALMTHYCNRIYVDRSADFLNTNPNLKFNFFECIRRFIHQGADPCEDSSNYASPYEWAIISDWKELFQHFHNLGASPGEEQKARWKKSYPAWASFIALKEWEKEADEEVKSLMDSAKSTAPSLPVSERKKRPRPT